MTILKRKKISFFASENDKAARVIRAEYHGPGAGRGRPKPLLELPGRFYNSTPAWDLYYQPDVRRVGYTGRGFQRLLLAGGGVGSDFRPRTGLLVSILRAA